ncbi:MAG: hypothetical protein AB1938_06180 [Myxococcota bacterium]
MTVSLKKLVDAKLAQRKISPDDAREVLAAVEKDKKFTEAEVKQLKRLTALSSSRFERPTEYIPNPLMADDGVYVKANPKKWLEAEVTLATAKLHVRSTIPEVTVKLSTPKEFSWDDLEEFGTHWARQLEVSFTGKTASRDGTISFTYADRSISVPVKAGESLEKVESKLFSALNRAEKGSVQIDGRIDPSKSGKQTVKYEVL